MKRYLNLILVMALASPLMLIAQSAQWTRFQPAVHDFDFSILFPGTPTVDPPSMDKDSAGALQSTSYLYRINGKGYYYCAVVTDYTYTLSSVDGELKADQNNFINAVKGSVVTSSTRGTFINGSEKLPDLTFTFDLPRTNQHGKSVVILRGRRVYMWLAMVTRNSADEGNMDTFVNSFAFTSRQ